MISNYKAIQNMCDKLGIRFHKNQYEMISSHQPISNLGIVPITNALHLVTKEYLRNYDNDLLLGAIAQDAQDVQSGIGTSTKSAVDALNILEQKRERYSKIERKAPKEYVFINYDKTKKQIFPKANDLKNAFVKHSHKQIKALKHVQSVTKNISKQTDGLTEDDNLKLGGLALRLNLTCGNYNYEYQDYSIDGPNELKSNMVELASQACDKLRTDIGKNTSEPRGKFDAKDYDFVMNNVQSTTYIEDRGNELNESEIKVLQPDTIGQIADDVADESAHRIEQLTEDINRAKSNLASHEID